MRPTRILVAAAAFLLGCGESALAPFGQLQSPIALALHEPSDNLYIASLAGDDLRVFNARSEEFLTAPVALFPLSIPTVRNPSALAAADRFVFVLSTAGAQVGFVDTVVQQGAAGPRGVNSPSGLPIVLPLDMVPSSMAAFAAAWPWSPDGSLSDHALVAGIDGDAEGGVLLALRPPVIEGGELVDLPSPEASIELPGIFPTAIALAPQGVPVTETIGPDGAPVVDCRTLAIADGRAADEGHVPGIWLTNVTVGLDGALTIDELDPSRRIEIRVPVQLAGGEIEERVAPVRALAFAPVPVTDSLLAAVAAEPCALRSGRIFAALDTSFCEGTSACPDLAVIDLSDDPTNPGQLAVDHVTGGPALYDFPGAPLEVVALTGPFRLPRAFDPVAVNEEGQAVPLDTVPVLAMVASTDGSLYYLDGGFGSYLVGPGRRAEAEPTFPIDANQAVAGLVGVVTRADLPGRVGPGATPTISVVPGDRPSNETWTAGFETPLPGFSGVSTVGAVAGTDTLTLPGGTRFVGGSLIASPNPLEADRVVPRRVGDVLCEGFPIVEVTADAVRFDRGALHNDPECGQAELPLDILPSIDVPWTLSGTVSGFVGRIPAGVEGARPTVEVVSGDRRLFVFTPPELDVARGATFSFQTTDGFAFYSFQPEVFGLLPASVQPFLVQPPRPSRDPSWRVFVAYSGSDSLVAVDPRNPRPGAGRVVAFQ